MCIFEEMDANQDSEKQNSTERVHPRDTCAPSAGLAQGAWASCTLTTSKTTEP